ncbi:FAD-binding oxidoreductase [Actinopolymorpha pittospori]|uniref:FAD/FMN-containing dehydrogenase n=1 Tax=Actinopolymorpha pittospori TaxID=648752 RepID=A0A927MQ58_9ACTN|nr:FAD-binding oxidoreductase [Actinopolymorpha pittospori]MBE1604850.1 FAD/FMN-containing dehydrogenase [Actinopolymorpha pittospori]
MASTRLRALDGADIEVSDTDIEAFAGQLRGRLVGPADLDYDEARAVWNGLIDKRPGLIARCTGTADVMAAVRFARAHELLLAVRGGGHNVAGAAVCDGGLVVDLSPMKAIRVNPGAGTVRAQGGVRIGDLDHESQAFGLAVPMGVVSETGIAGLTLGGGYGWLTRKYGLSCDNLLSADVVTADGRWVRAGTGPDDDLDLLWAIRGGGGNFGVVTSFDFRAHPIGPEVYFGFVVHAGSAAGEALRGIRAFIEQAPEGVMSVAVLWHGPPLEQIPAEHHGKPVAIHLAVYAGDPAEGERALRAARDIGNPIADLSGPMRYVDLQRFLDVDYPAHDLRYYWKSRYLSGLPDDLIDLLVQRNEASPSPLNTFEMWSLGGAAARVATQDSAFGDRSAPYLLGVEANWERPEDDTANLAWVREVHADVEPFSTGREYVNFPGFYEDENLVRETFGPNFRRLASLKKRYDPMNLFRLNHNIPPAP